MPIEPSTSMHTDIKDYELNHEHPAMWCHEDRSYDSEVSLFCNTHQDATTSRVEWCYIVCTYICLSIFDRHLGCHHLWAPVSDAAVNIADCVSQFLFSGL